MQQRGGTFLWKPPDQVQRLEDKRVVPGITELLVLGSLLGCVAGQSVTSVRSSPHLSPAFLTISEISLRKLKEMETPGCFVAKFGLRGRSVSGLRS